jgi:geranylgeranyl diphosphate synthase type II
MAVLLEEIMPSTDHASAREFFRFAAELRPAIENALESNLPTAPSAVESKFNDAVRYAVFPGGKRLRPVLTMLGAELFGGRPENVLNAAAAVEYIHTSSLIFDDLPCMDDSPERRGRLSLHEKFGEGLSTLVAIGFLNQSYQLVTLDANGNRERSVRAVLEIVDSVGPAGMVGGQSVDLKIATENECKLCSRSRLSSVLNLKTSALIKLALRLGAILSGANGDGRVDVLTRFAESLGQAYQISDDIIDLREDARIFGEPGNGDHLANAMRLLAEESARAKGILTDNFPASPARECLIELVDYVASRKD